MHTMTVQQYLEWSELVRWLISEGRNASRAVDMANAAYDLTLPMSWAVTE